MSTIPAPAIASTSASDPVRPVPETGVGTVGVTLIAATSMLAVRTSTDPDASVPVALSVCGPDADAGIVTLPKNAPVASVSTVASSSGADEDDRDLDGRGGREALRGDGDLASRGRVGVRHGQLAAGSVLREHGLRCEDQEQKGRSDGDVTTHVRYLQPVSSDETVDLRRRTSHTHFNPSRGVEPRVLFAGSR